MTMPPADPAVLLRCDGGAVDGMGHVMQCLTLAGGFKKNGVDDIRFITCSPDMIGRRRIEAAGFTAAAAPAAAGSAEDLAFVLEQLRQTDRALLIIDNRTIDSAYMQRCRELAFVAVIDDQAAQQLPCDAVLNYHPGFSASDYVERTDGHLLLGPQYNLLRDEFFEPEADFNREPADRLHILITLGGEDPFNHSGWLLQHLADRFATHEITVIVGAAHPAKEAVSVAVARYVPHARLIENTDRMAACMRRADICFTAGGTTCYELAAMGVPQLAIVLEPFQHRLVNTLSEVGCLISLGWHADLDPERVARTFAGLAKSIEARAAMRRAAGGLFPESGARAAAAQLLQHFNQKESL